MEKIDIEVRSLELCAFNRETFDEILSKIQKAVDDLNLHSYSNLSSWVKTLDEEVSIILIFMTFSRPFLFARVITLSSPKQTGKVTA